MSKAKDQPPQTMRLRFNRGVSLGGTAYTSSQVAVVEATEEAWQAVNRGDANLDPGPGVEGQPFPPEFVTRGPETEVPLPPGPEELAEERKAQRERQKARAAEQDPPAPAAPALPGGPAPPSPAPADYEAMHADELHREAAARDIPGRGSMDKGQLVKALQKSDKDKAKGK